MHDKVIEQYISALEQRHASGTSLGVHSVASFFVSRVDTAVDKIVDQKLAADPGDANLDRTVNRDGEGKNPFHQPHYLLLNLAIGGASGGDPSATRFPARFEVDYVRVYQKVNG